MQGLHLTADLYGCGCDTSLLIDADKLAELCRRAVGDARLTIVDEKFFTFPDYQGQPGGVTGAVLLAESHLALHTWPERGGVTLDVYVCNFSTDNSGKAEGLLDSLIVAFAPREQETNRILRGGNDPASDVRNGELLLEGLGQHAAYGLRVNRRLETIRSPYQLVEVFESGLFGRLFRLDGCYMTSEGDEFFYHEPMVHPAAITHGAPTSALVIGGGDGGSSEELLKYPSMRRVVMAELDPVVVDVARRYLSGVHRGVFDDPRLEVRIGDAWDLVGKLDETFDLVVLDLTDPETPAERLYTGEFFDAIKRVLSPSGAVTLHIGSPIYKPATVKRLVGLLRERFRHVRPMGNYVPLYGCYWGFAMASDALDPLALGPDEVDGRIEANGLEALSFYNGDTHRSLFALPNYYRRLLD
jgi:spermidine synthase